MIDYEGIKEIQPNRGFYNKEFEKSMRLCGFRARMAWCSLFAKHIWREFGIVAKNGRDYRAISPSVMETYRTFKKIATQRIPRAGSLVIWQHPTDKIHGHTGVVVRKIDRNTVLTLEGNTNGRGVREGDGVYLKVRKFRETQYTFIGFIPCRRNRAFQKYINERVNKKTNSWL